MFIGDKSRTGATVIPDAIDMLESGVSKEEVFQKTGCLVGLEGKWKLEADLEGLTFSNDFRLLSFSGSPEFNVGTVFYKPDDNGLFDFTAISPSESYDGYHLSQIDRETLSEHVPEELLERIDSREGKKYSDGSYFLDGLDYTRVNTAPECICLLDALEPHDILNEYHQFANVFIRVDPELDGANVKELEPHERVHPSSDFLITLGKHDQMESLVHELQHVVQRLNGFCIGGNHKNFSPKNAHEHQIKKLQQSLYNLYQSNPNFAIDSSMVQNRFMLLSNRYTTERGTCDWLSVPKAQSSDYFAMLKSLQDDYPEEYERETAIRTDIDRLLRKSGYSEWSPVEQYRSLAGEIEAYATGERYGLTHAERRGRFPIGGYEKDRAILFFDRDDNIGFELAYKTPSISHFTHPSFKRFSTLFVKNTATPDDIVTYCAEFMLEVYSDLANELPEDNSIVKDYKRIMAMLRVDPDKYSSLMSDEKAAAIKTYTDEFKGFLSSGYAPKGLGAVFGVLKKWVVGIFRGMPNSPIVENVSNADLYERMFSNNIELSLASSFQSKLSNELRNVSEFTPDVVLSLSSFVDSMVESISERSGLSREDVESRYNMVVAPHVANKVRLTV